MEQEILRQPAEKLFEEELNALIKAESDPVPQVENVAALGKDIHMRR